MGENQQYETKIYVVVHDLSLLSPLDGVKHTIKLAFNIPYINQTTNLMSLLNDDWVTKWITLGFANPIEFIWNLVTQRPL